MSNQGFRSAYLRMTNREKVSSLIVIFAVVAIAVASIANAVAQPNGTNPATVAFHQAEADHATYVAEQKQIAFAKGLRAAEYNAKAEYYAPVVAQRHIDNGVDTAKELWSCGLEYKGTAYCIVQAHVNKKIDARRAAEAEAAKERQSYQVASRSGSSSSAKSSSSSSGNSKAYSGGGVWSKSQVESTLRASCNSQGITGSDQEWVVATGLKVAWGESRYNTGARNPSGKYLGLFQMSPSWGSAENRLNGAWSCRVFVRTFKQGGKAKIRQHWAATI